MLSPQASLLVWCDGCDSFTADERGHRCSHTEKRREAMRRGADLFPARLERHRERNREYQAHVREQARIRAARRAS